MKDELTQQIGTYRHGPARPGRLGRAVGFSLLAGMSLAVFAWVVLGPAYAEMSETRHQRDCIRADLDEAERWIAANARLIADLPSDEVMTKRLAESQLNWLPTDEYVVIDPAAKPAPQRLVNVRPGHKPARPDGLAIRLGRKAANPTLRRVLLAIAAGFMLSAAVVFAPRYGTRPDDS